MGIDYSKKREELRDSVVKIMYVANHSCESVTVPNHKDTILKTFDAIKCIPNPTIVPIKDILKILSFIINLSETVNNDQAKLASILKNVLVEEKIIDIQNYFQSLDGYLRNQYPYIQNDADKIQQLNAEVKTVREHCSTLYNTMMRKNHIPVDPFWFFVSSMFLLL